MAEPMSLARRHLMGQAAVWLFCASLAGAQNWELTFVSDLNIVTGTPVDAIAAGDPARAQTIPGAELSHEEVLRRKASGEFGGISALAYDDKTKLLYALSDSAKPVLFTMRLAIEGNKLNLAEGRSTLLRTSDGIPIPEWTLDPEGLALTAARTLFVSSEGYPGRKPPVDAAILEFDLSGRLRRRLPIPEKFLSKRAQTGVRPNAGFEGLSLSPDGKRLFAAAEGALEQDGPACSLTSGCVARLLEYEIRGSSVRPAREFAYPIDPLGDPPGFAKPNGATGISEILALSRNDLLVLERSYAVEPGTRRSLNQIRIFAVSLRGATDISRSDSLANSTGYRPLKKKLLFDAGQSVSQFSAGFQLLDNFEGMCFGPRFPDGSRSMIVVSDNNYAERQRTAFLLLKLRNGN